MDDGFAYVACDTVGVVIFSVADARHSAAPEYVASMSNHEILSFDGSRACSTYWTGSEGRAYITDLSGSSSPELIFNGDTSISEIEVCGDYAFIANRADGLAIIDISDPANPSEPIFVETAIGPNYSAEDVDVAGEYAYIANYYGGLAIVDLADPTAPGALRIVNDGYYANAIEIQEGWGFVAGGRYDKGLVILDVSDPDNPGTAIVTNLDDHIARDITIWNDLALVAVDDVGLAIVDVSDPENPGTPVYASITGDGNSVDVSWPYAFVQVGSQTAVIDISDPSAPGAPIWISDTGAGLVVRGNTLYSGSGSDGLAKIQLWQSE